MGSNSRNGGKRRTGRTAPIAIAFACAVAFSATAQQNPNAVASFVAIDAPVVALTHARVVDGTGAAARADQTIVIRDGNIIEVGDSLRGVSPSGATVVDLTGKSVIPGLVMVHEHLYYPTGPGVYGQLGGSFSRLYLAGGVTTMRTGGNTNGIMDLSVARRIAAGEMPGPEIDATAPYLNGPSTFLQMHAVTNADEAGNHVAYWAGQGATSLKADLIVVAGDPSRTIADVRRVEVVFKRGVGFSPAKLIESVRGQVGVW